MNKNLKTLLQLTIGVLIAAALMYITFKDRSIGDLANDMKAADPFWMFMAALTLLAVYIFRALRWKLMLDSSDYPANSFNTIISMLICYLVNSVTPRIGEVARCSVLLKTDKIPIPASLGTIFTERIIDALVLFGGLGIIFLTEFQRLRDLFAVMFSNILGGMENSLWLLTGMAVVAIGGIIGLFFFLRSERARQGIAGKFHDALSTMLKASQSIFRLQKPWLFFVHTALIWLALVAMNYFFLKSLPDTQDFGVYVAILILFIGGLGWALPVPGGIGTTHYIIVQLFLAFNLSETAGQNFGLLSNGATFIFTIFFGLIAWLLFLYIVYQKENQKKNPDPAINS
ncbi:MAG: flippase-like domain-containing protein [Bacteroidetes bacterium]|nr:flippase-like domain-containing protein [Bacteroidota bacterium]